MAGNFRKYKFAWKTWLTVVPNVAFHVCIACLLATFHIRRRTVWWCYHNPTWLQNGCPECESCRQIFSRIPGGNQLFLWQPLFWGCRTISIHVHSDQNRYFKLKHDLLAIGLSCGCLGCVEGSLSCCRINSGLGVCCIGLSSPRQSWALVLACWLYMNSCCGWVWRGTCWVLGCSEIHGQFLGIRSDCWACCGQ